MALVLWVAPRSPWWLLGWMVAAGLSDLLDGWVARRQGLPREGLGAWLDPLCDKAFFLSALLAAWAWRAPPAWLALAASTRELVLLPLVIARLAVPRLRHAGLPWRALALGKATTVAQFTLFGAVLLELEVAWAPLALISAVLGAAAGAQYAARSWRHLTSTPHTPGGASPGGPLV
jgi:cardiolipin synthase